MKSAVYVAAYAFCFWARRAIVSDAGPLVAGVLRSCEGHVLRMYRNTWVACVILTGHAGKRQQQANAV